MRAEEFVIAMPGGTADCVVYRPDGDGKWPGVIHLTDIGGIRPAHRVMAQRLAGEGYAVLMPNVFYRTARPPVFEMKPGSNEEAMMKRFGELAAPLTPQAIETDAAVYVDALTSRDDVAEGGIGVVGYCFTGGVAVRFAATRPDRISAAASFHGGNLWTDAPTSPHRVLPRVQAELYFAHAWKDRTMPEEAIRKLEEALDGWGGKYTSEVYEGAYHSWTASDSPAYNAGQADRAFAKLVSLLRATLP